MKKTRLPIFERALLEWAYRREYVVKDRKWQANLISERAVDLNLGKEPDQINLMKADYNEDEAKQIEIENREDFPDYTREIIIPTGLIECDFIYADRNPNERNLAEYLKSGKEPFTGFSLWLGNYIKNWRSETIPKEERKENWIIFLRLVIDSPDKYRFIRPVDLTVTLNQEYFSQRLNDPLYRALFVAKDMKAFLGEQEENPLLRKTADAYSFDLDSLLENNILYSGLVDKNGKPLDPNWGGKDISDHLWLPNTEQSYKLFLDRIADIIEPC